MKIKVELSEEDLKRLIMIHIENLINDGVDINKVRILVKSKQNYKSEWETAEFRAVFES